METPFTLDYTGVENYDDQTLDVSLNIKPDTDAPTNKDVILTVEYGSDVFKVEYSWDGDIWEIYPAEGVKVENNNTTVFFRGLDESDDPVGSAEYTVTNIDRVPPEKPAASADVTDPTRGQVTVDASFSEDSVRYEYSKNGSDWESYDGSGVIFAENGFVEFRSYDAADNVSEQIKYEVNNIDHVPPAPAKVTASITDPTRDNVLLTVEFAEDAVCKEYSPDGIFWADYPEAGVTVTENRKYFFRSSDAAGNVSEVVEYSVTNIDRLPPEKPAASADMTSSTNENVTVNCNFSSDSVRFEFNKNGLGWLEYDKNGVPFAENGTVEFRSYDAAGNVSEPVKYEVTNIDKNPPAVPDAFADTTSPTNKDVTVNCNFSSDSVRYEYSKNGSDWESYDGSGIVFAENGFVEFRSYDAAGNVSEQIKYVVNNIDKILPAAPRVAIDRSDYISNEPVTLVAAADEGTLEYSFDGEHWFNYTEPVLIFENTVVRVRTTDAAGNFAETTAEITTIDPTADSSMTQYIFIKSGYTEKNTANKKVNGIELKYGKNAFASLEDAKKILNDPADPLYVFVMLDGKSVLSGLLEGFTGKTVNGSQQKSELEEKNDSYDYTVAASAKNSMNIVSGNYSATDIKWFKNVNISGRAQVGNILGGAYKMNQVVAETVNSRGILTESENYSASYKSSGKLTADSFAKVGNIDYFSTVVLDNVSVGDVTGGEKSDKRKIVYKYQGNLPQKSIQISGSWTASGSITLKNIASSDKITGYKKLTLTNATVLEIYGGSGKYAYKEQSTYKLDKVSRSVTLSESFSASGTLTARCSILDSIYGIATVKLIDSVVGNVKNGDVESLNGTVTEKLGVSTSSKGIVTATYEKNSTFKRNGSFSATAANDKMTVGDVMYFNTVKLDQAVAGTIGNLLQTQDKEVYQQVWANAAEYGIADDLALNIDFTKAQLVSAIYKYSASGSVTLKNNASAQAINDYKNVTIDDSSVEGDIKLGDCCTVRYTADFSASGSGNKTETTITTYTRSGSVKVTDSTVGGNITGYNKVVLDNSSAGNISQSTLTKSVSKKVNGIDDVNNSYIREKLSGAVTLKNKSAAGDITNYASVTLNDSSAGNLINVNKVSVGKGHGSITSFTGTGGNDTFTVSKGAVFTVTDKLDFGAGNKDKLVVNGTLVLHTANLTGVEKITGKGDIAVTDAVARALDTEFENLLNLGNTVRNFQGSAAELSDNTVSKAVKWDGEEIFEGWLGNDVDCIDTVDFITFRTGEACTLQIASSAWENPSTDIVAVNNVILNTVGGVAEINLAADTEYTIKLERKDSNSMSYVITLA